MTASDKGGAIAQAAKALVGVPFRLHGRNPATGLDCVGVVVAALATTGDRRPFPCDYRLHMRDVTRFTLRAGEFGLIACHGQPFPGDIRLFHVGPCQHHVAICAGNGRLIHAHAGLRRVVESPSLTSWLLVGHWRLDASNGE